MSPKPNRVTPAGAIEALPQRGLFTGNRGILHDGQTITRPFQHDSWVICELEFRGRWSEQWLPHHFTWLYFYDEAVALAAGHRPCGQCRWRSYDHYRRAWARGHESEIPTAREMNPTLPAQRVERPTRRPLTHAAPWGGLPTGTFVTLDDTPHLVLDDALVAWTPAGYGQRTARPTRGRATVLTPQASVAVLGAGYPVQLHPAL